MTEKKVVNEYYMDNSMLYSYVFKIICKKAFLIGLMVCFFLGVGVFLVGIELLYKLNYAILFFVLMEILLPITYIRNIKKAEKRLHQEEHRKTIVTFGECITMDEENNHLEFSYNQISKICYTKQVWALMLGKYNAIIVKPTGFTQGTAAEFKQFIEERCKNI